jgi:hypothetical protein
VVPHGGHRRMNVDLCGPRHGANHGRERRRKCLHGVITDPRTPPGSPRSEMTSGGSQRSRLTATGSQTADNGAASPHLPTEAGNEALEHRGHPAVTLVMLPKRAVAQQSYRVASDHR